MAFKFNFSLCRRVSRFKVPPFKFALNPATPQMPRIARSKKVQENSDSDSDPTDVEATPRAKRTAGGNSRLKRRVSQFQPNEDDNEQRIPLKPFNDEVAEKRDLKRRKSARMTMAIDSTGVSQEDQTTPGDASVGPDGQKTPRKTALARANQLKSVVMPGPAVPVSLEIMTSNFEEWMKMATDNVYFYLILSCRSPTESLATENQC